VAQKRGRKHNNPRRDVLLDRVVVFAEGGTEQGELAGRRVLLDLLEHGPAVVVSDAAHELTSWDSSQLQQLQGRLRTFLRGVVGLTDAEEGLVPEVTIGRLTFGVTPVRRSSVVVTVDGAAGDVVLFQLVQLLQATGAGRLRRCAAADCSKVFAKTGRREFCSAVCQSRIYMRALRQRERGRNSRRRQHGKTTRKR
jgi:hypothetical protein